MKHLPLSALRRASVSGLFLLAILTLPAKAQPAKTQKTQQLLDQATRNTTAIALIVDAKSGHLIASERPEDAAHLRSRPGSILKPLFLASALEQNLIHPQTTVFCRKSLRIAGRDLPCTHPQSDTAFNADDALAYSCNTWFAELANHLSPQQTIAIARSWGLAEPSHLFPSESSPELQPPISTEQKQLFVLGLSGISITPTQIAAAYQKLALKLRAPQQTPALQTVAQGLSHSVEYGMAHNADVPGLPVSGKTGTASDTGQAWTHGWFAGFATAHAETIVLVFYIPHGNGADAAHAAQQFLHAWKAEP